MAYIIQIVIHLHCRKSAIAWPFFKNSDQTDPNCYRPISNFSYISKVLEKPVNKQLNDYLNDNSIFSGMLSGFWPGYDCGTAVQNFYVYFVSWCYVSFRCQVIYVLGICPKNTGTSAGSILYKHLHMTGCLPASENSLRWYYAQLLFSWLVRAACLLLLFIAVEVDCVLLFFTFMPVLFLLFMLTLVFVS